MKRPKLKLRKKRAFFTFLIIWIIGVLLFPKQTALFTLLIFMVYVIIMFVKEWKAVLLITVLVLSYTIMDNSLMNTVILGFFFNVVYINLSFNPHWSRTKLELQQLIEEKQYKDKVSFDEPFFEQIRDRSKAIYTMIFYAISILPYVTLNILINNKDYLFNHVPIINTIYKVFLTVFESNGNTSSLQKHIDISCVLIFFYMILVLVIIKSLKEQRILFKKIKDKRSRKKDYWNGLEFKIDENDLIFLEVIKS